MNRPLGFGLWYHRRNSTQQRLLKNCSFGLNLSSWNLNILLCNDFWIPTVNTIHKWNSKCSIWQRLVSPSVGSGQRYSIESQGYKWCSIKIMVCWQKLTGGRTVKLNINLEVPISSFYISVINSIEKTLRFINQ